jgi:broad-specificity NMP kinase
MENNQITIDDLIDKKPIVTEKSKKQGAYFTRMDKLEKQVAKLEKEITIIIQSLRR